MAYPTVALMTLSISKQERSTQNSVLKTQSISSRQFNYYSHDTVRFMQTVLNIALMKQSLYKKHERPTPLSYLNFRRMQAHRIALKI